MAATSKSTGCMTAAVASFPRIFLLLAWFGRPVMKDLMFASFILPCLSPAWDSSSFRGPH